MDKSVTIKMSELKELMIENSVHTVGEVLMKTGLMKEMISFAEIKKMYGEAIAEEASQNPRIEWFIQARKGKGVSKFCKMAEFRKWLISTDRVKLLH